ncbi:ABC transporter, membrane spanning protein (bacteriocin) [Fulvimarina pelagi HTCC2506]|uniref:Membrane fusion protein (MFP) family protein n=1 Tax=Fulvimarina pelagi HTCC2506 TaxID=314231 RepID=Q0G347_9HYPH|nr:HlyD family type I secretion periplasmic adaptor subunit [Fulvimarina pelagi]EAU41984.1 ABC transporter, membrane spanning protein (bacteriocin) [Fulvimarina pelagi HTCC2506]
MTKSANNTAPAVRRPRDKSFGIGSRVFLASTFAILLVVGCGGWSVQAKLSGAVIAQGQVTVRTQVKEVQHRDGGIIKEILVEPGSTIEAGDVLLRLDETQTRAELGVLRSQLAELRGRKARLIAERDGAAEVVVERDAEGNTISETILKGEQRLFGDNRATRDAQRKQLQAQIDQFAEQIRALEAQQQSNAAERALVADDLDRLMPLVRRQVVEASRTRTLERDIARLDGLTGEIAANIARVRGQISESELKIIELDQQVRTDAQRELRDVEGKIAELRERAVAALDRMDRMDLRAPISGIVNEVRVHTIGGVIASAETVMTIVPEGEELVVEARLSPVDIDQVEPGQTAKLRFSAFNQHTTPEIAGTVEIVGAAASLDQATGQAYYLATIGIPDDTVISRRSLVPGMPVEVFLQTKERTALSYLVKPFTDQMQRALREE